YGCEFFKQVRESNRQTLVHFFFSSRRRHTIWPRDWSSDVCSSDLPRHSHTSDAMRAVPRQFKLPSRRRRSLTPRCSIYRRRRDYRKRLGLVLASFSGNIMDGKLHAVARPLGGRSHIGWRRDYLRLLPQRTPQQLVVNEVVEGDPRRREKRE